MMADSTDDVTPCKRTELADSVAANGLEKLAKPKNGQSVSSEDGAGPEAKSNVSKESDALEKFEVVRVLNHLRERHCIFLLAKDKSTNEENAVIKLEKTAFKDDISELNRVCSSEVGSSLQFRNDIYANFMTTPTSESFVRDFASIKTSLIHPASEKHIVKYLAQEIFFVEETADDYHSITLPHLTEDQFSFQWIYNILDHKKEVERIIFEEEDPVNGFVLLPDMKWDGQQVTDLYCSAIIRQRGIKSIRDLRANHLPLLRNILEKGSQAIKDKYNVPRSQLVMYFHYQPSYYHLHVHFTHVAFEAPGRDTSGAHVLQTVIDNIERDNDHYAKCSLPFKLKASTDLCRKYKEAGKI